MKSHSIEGAVNATQTQQAVAVGVMIRVLRDVRGWTQAELGERSGINRPNISRLEAGRYGSLPQLATILRLARALDVKPSAILGVLDGPRHDRKRSDREAYAEEVAAARNRASAAETTLSKVRAWADRLVAKKHKPKGLVLGFEALAILDANGAT